MPITLVQCDDFYTKFGALKLVHPFLHTQPSTYSFLYYLLVTISQPLRKQIRVQIVSQRLISFLLSYHSLPSFILPHFTTPTSISPRHSPPILLRCHSLHFTIQLSSRCLLSSSRLTDSLCDIPSLVLSPLSNSFSRSIILRFTSVITIIPFHFLSHTSILHPISL